MKISGKRSIIIILAIIVILLAFLAWSSLFSQRTDEIAPAAFNVERNYVLYDDQGSIISVARELEIPWALDFLPDGSIIITERPGRVRLIDPSKGLAPEPLIIIEEVAHTGEGGLLGIAVHPDFENNSFIYVYHTYRDEEGLKNRVLRFRKEGNRLVDPVIIIENIPGASIHNGGRIKFGPDGYLYITTGDAAQRETAQNMDSLAGKILRLKDDGSIPLDNPFAGSPIYSYGHRNPQGLTWDNEGRLWATEHGSFATDEVNLIEPGKNYGWAEIRGDDESSGLESPYIHSGSSTWAPSGIAYLDSSLFFSGLRGQSIYEIRPAEDPRMTVSHFSGSFGRIRDVVVGPDDYLYILTSNRDGRGTPAPEDDQMVRIDPDIL